MDGTSLRGKSFMSNAINPSHTIHLVQHEIRGRICACCPWRTPDAECPNPDEPRPCEHNCPVFVHLPTLIESVEMLEPMVGSPERTLRHALNYTIAQNENSPEKVERLRYHKKELIDVIEKMESLW